MEKEKICRDLQNKIFFGVCAGLASALEFNVNKLRLISVILTILTCGWTIGIYLIAAIIMPKNQTTKEKND
ncbi:MAG: PspC domain-containing protein [Mycoplasmatales bacterium]